LFKGRNKLRQQIEAPNVVIAVHSFLPEKSWNFYWNKHIQNQHHWSLGTFHNNHKEIDNQCLMILATNKKLFGF